MGALPYLILAPQEQHPKGAWRKQKMVSLLKGCQLLTVDITLPFGCELDDNAISDWVINTLPNSSQRNLDLLRWHALGRRNAPDGTRHRVLLVTGNSASIAQMGSKADVAWPHEFSLLAQAETQAAVNPENFVWSTALDGESHALVYRQGMLAAWFHEPIPEHDSSWLPARQERLLAFLKKDLFAEPQDSWTWKETTEAPLDREAMSSLGKWSWIESLNMLPKACQNQRENMRGLYSFAKTAASCLAVIAIACICLWFLVHQQQSKFQNLVTQSGSLLKIRNEESALQDSLQAEATTLATIGVEAQPPLKFPTVLQGFFHALPPNSRVDQLHMSTLAPDGVRWNLQVIVPDWDGADLYWKNFQALSGFHGIRLESRRPTSDGQIQLRVEGIQ